MTTASIWRIALLYDSECPLCMREVNFLQRQDNGRGLVRFVDIADDNYDPADYGNVSFAAAMERIHAVLPDGTVLQNVAVFRYTYDLLGIGWIYSITKVPIIGQFVDVLYGIWAKYRLKLTGRPDLITLIQTREERLNCRVNCELSGELNRECHL
jgi:predicted DCC family thiol-disulfide oxidoreductase YuxK